METRQILPYLHMLRFEVGQAYLWADPGELTLIDCGTAGAAPGIATAINRLGYERRDLRRLVLTHFHDDHIGNAAELASWGGVEVMAHRADAPVIRGQAPAQAPNLQQWEIPLYESTVPKVPPAPPARVDRELEDGDTIGFGGGASVVSVPGHTHGSIAVHLPVHRLLFTGDAVAGQEGRVVLGLFNADRDRALLSMRRLAEFDTDTACFGHGDPVVGGASEQLREVADLVAGTE